MNVKNWQEKIYTWLLLVPGILPLLYKEEMMYPMLAPKTFILRALSILTIAFFVYLVFAGKEFYFYRLKKWWTWIPVGLLAVAYTSSLLSIDFYHSFWSTFERGDGLITYTAIISYFYLIILSVDEEWLRRLFKIVAWTGLIAAWYVIVQWFFSMFGIESSFIAPSSGRLGGTFGNAAFFSAYAAMVFFVSLYVAKEHKGALKKFFYFGAGSLLFAILIAATRGTILALGIIGFLMLAYFAWRGKKYMRIIFGAVLILTGVFFLYRENFSQSSIAPIARIASISLNDPTVSSRIFVWKNMAQAVLQHPFLGIGAEHVDIYFDQFYDPSILQEEWFDRSHNIYLDYAAQFGIFGFALYLGLLSSLFWMGWLLYKKGESIGIYVLGITAVYVIQNLFVFDTSSTFWLLLAIFSGVCSMYIAKESPLTFSLIKTPKKVIGGIASVSIALLVIPVTVMPWRANLFGFQAYLYQVADLPRSIEATEQGLSLNTYADLEYGYNAYFMYTENQYFILKGDELKNAYENTKTILMANAERYPYDVRTLVYLAQVLTNAPLGIHEEKELITSIASKARDGSLRRLQPWYILANLSIGEANQYPIRSSERIKGYQAAIDILEDYSSSVPNLSEPYFVIAQLYYAIDKIDAAAASATQGKMVYKSNLGAARRAAMYYETVLDIPNAEFFLREVLRLDPTDENAQADLELIEQYQ